MISNDVNRSLGAVKLGFKALPSNNPAVAETSTSNTDRATISNASSAAIEPSAAAPQARPEGIAAHQLLAPHNLSVAMMAGHPGGGGGPRPAPPAPRPPAPRPQPPAPRPQPPAPRPPAPRPQPPAPRPQPPAPRPPAPRPPAPQPHPPTPRPPAPQPHPPAPKPPAPKPPTPQPHPPTPKPPAPGPKPPTPQPHPPTPKPPAPGPKPPTPQPHPPTPKPGPNPPHPTPGPGPKPGPRPPAPKPPAPRPGPRPAPPGRAVPPHPPAAPPTHPVSIGGGKSVNVPQGGWVTKAQRNNPNIHTTVINNNTVNSVNIQSTVVNNVHSYHDNDWGHGWYQHPDNCGFYSGSSFFLGFALGSALQADWDYATQPVYLVSPVTGYPCGTLEPPEGTTTFPDQSAVQAQMLGMMANPVQDPASTTFDPAAGLYAATANFDPANPGQKISADNAFNMLSNGQSLFFHPPNSDWEGLSSLSDLNVYLYSKEDQPA